jgi:hypothetical protein
MSQAKNKLATVAPGQEMAALKRTMAEKVARQMVGEGRDACVYATYAQSLMQKDPVELLAMLEKNTGPLPTYRVESLQGKGDHDCGFFRLHDPPSFMSALQDRLNAFDDDGYEIVKQMEYGNVMILVGRLRKE